MNLSVIEIGARKYSIELVHNKEFQVRLKNCGIQDDEIKAFVDYDIQMIVIRDDLSKEHKRELVIHEIFHALLEDSGCAQDDQTEKIIRTLSPRLNAAFSGLNVVLNDLQLLDS